MNARYILVWIKSNIMFTIIQRIYFLNNTFVVDEDQVYSFGSLLKLSVHVLTFQN